MLTFSSFSSHCFFYSFVSGGRTAAHLMFFCIRLRFQRSHTVPCFLVGFTWEQECRRHAPLGSLRQRTHACTAMGVHHHVQQWLTRAHTHTHEGITAHACTAMYTLIKTHDLDIHTHTDMYFFSL